MFLLCTSVRPPSRRSVRPERAQQQHGLNAENDKGPRTLFALMPRALYVLCVVAAAWMVGATGIEPVTPAV